MLEYQEEYREKVAKARRYYFGAGELPTGLVSDTIAASWQRCNEQGLSAGSAIGDTMVQVHRPQEALDKNESLLSYARPVMENLYDQIRNTDSVVVLADASGVLVHSLGDPVFVGKANTVGLTPGFSWNERFRGTNAVGTAIVEERPLVVHGNEHYLDKNVILTCSASPVFNPRGDLIGVLDISGDSRAYQRHTLALVQMSAQMIENRMLASEYESQLIVNFHARPEFLGTLCEGIAVFSLDGKLLAANRSALFQLDIKRRDVPRHRFASLFDLDINEALNYVRFGRREPFALPSRGGIRLFAHARCGAISLKPLFFSGSTTTLDNQPAPQPPSTREEPCPRPLIGAPATLEDLLGSDSRIEAAAMRVKKLLGKDIPLLIEGETGTGKEMFARAFHNSSPRRHKPFVAVNCAAIPEGLIESELFGYQEGAFTGAKRKGNVGKIAQADGGTLFLDEIGDMPLNLQARLLRVLQEREVVPLGATKPIPVDITLVTATNRKLREEVDRGTFREDLYYRVNGLRITLPPLRERSDLGRIVNSLVADETRDGPAIGVSEEVIKLLYAYRWPGNIRQMRSIVRTALAMLDDGDHSLEVRHLPEDILEEIERASHAAHAPNPQGAAGVASPHIPAAAGGNGHLGIGLPAAGMTSGFSIHAPVTAPPAPAVPAGLSLPLDGACNLAELELSAIHRALEECRGNVSAAARRLGISRNTLYRKLGRL